MFREVFFTCEASWNKGGILETPRKIIPGKKNTYTHQTSPRPKCVFFRVESRLWSDVSPRIKGSKHLYEGDAPTEQTKMPKSLMLSSHNQAFSNTDYFQKRSQKINPPSLNPNPASAVPVFSFREGMVDISSTCIIRPADLLDPRF